MRVSRYVEGSLPSEAENMEDDTEASKEARSQERGSGSNTQRSTATNDLTSFLVGWHVAATHAEPPCIPLYLTQHPLKVSTDVLVYAHVAYVHSDPAFFFQVRDSRGQNTLESTSYGTESNRINPAFIHNTRCWEPTNSGRVPSEKTGGSMQMGELKGEDGLRMTKVAQVSYW